MTAYDEKPKGEPPGESPTGYWGQCRDGKWRAFYNVMGPQRSFNIEHPYDPNWWSNHPLPPETNRASGGERWACRHGKYEGGNCNGSNSSFDGEICGAHPSITLITEEVIEESVANLSDWIKELS